jgi:hypothetical protein
MISLFHHWTYVAGATPAELMAVYWSRRQLSGQSGLPIVAVKWAHQLFAR